MIPASLLRFRRDRLLGLSMGEFHLTFAPELLRARIAVPSVVCPHFLETPVGRRSARQDTFAQQFLSKFQAIATKGIKA